MLPNNKYAKQDEFSVRNSSAVLCFLTNNSVNLHYYFASFRMRYAPFATITNTIAPIIKSG